MTLKTLKNLIPNKSTLRQIESSISVWIYSCVYGLVSGFFAPAIKILQFTSNPFYLTKPEISWNSVITSIGNISSILITGFFCRYMGRKPLIASGLLLLFLSWIWNWLAVTVVQFDCSQFLLGAGLGVYDVINCIYMSEISSPQNRGTFITMCSVLYNVGVEIQFIVGIFNNYWLLSLIPAVVSLIGVLLVPCTVVESPHYLMMKDDKEKAWKCVARLNAGENSDTVKSLYEDLAQYIEEEKQETSIIKFFLIPENYNMCVCLLIVNTFVYVNVFDPLQSYLSIVMSPYPEINVDVVLNLLGVIILLTMFVSPIMVNSFGRRFLMIGGFFTMSFFQIATGVCFYAISIFQNSIPYLPMCIVIILILGKITFAITIFPTTHILRAELFPYKLKVSGTIIAVILKAIGEGITGSLFFPISSVFGIGFNCFLNAIFAIFAGVYAYFYLLETKGKTLTEIKEDYRLGKNRNKQSSTGGD